MDLASQHIQSITELLGGDAPGRLPALLCAGVRRRGLRRAAVTVLVLDADADWAGGGARGVVLEIAARDHGRNGPVAGGNGKPARRNLCGLGVLQEDVRGIPGTLHFRLDVAALILCLQACLAKPAPAAETVPAGAAPEFARNRQTSLRRSRKLVCGDAANKNARTTQTITEITPENTQKNIRSQTKPVLPAALKEGQTQKPNPPAPFPVKEGGDGRKILPFPDREGWRLGFIGGAAGLGSENLGSASVLLTPKQCQVNQQGTARFKEALRQAVVQAAQKKRRGF